MTPSKRFSACWAGKCTGASGSIKPCSLSKATRLPQKVTEPMMPDTTVATAVCAVVALPASASTAPAMSADAPPPKALSKATI